MKFLRSHLMGQWHPANSETGSVVVDPTTEVSLATVSSSGVDFQSAVEFSRNTGGSALRELTFSQRGELLIAMSKAIH